MDIYYKYITNKCNNILHKYLPIDLIDIINSYLLNNYGTYNDYLKFIEKKINNYFSNNISKIIFNYYNNTIYTASMYYNNLDDYIIECNKKNRFTIDFLPNDLYIDNIVYVYELDNKVNLKEIYDKIKLDKNKICSVQYNNNKKSLIDKKFRIKKDFLQFLVNINNLYINININRTGYVKIYGCNKNYMFQLNNILKEYNLNIKKIHTSQIIGKVKLEKKIDINLFKKLLEKKKIYPYINNDNFLIIYVSKIHKLLMYNNNENFLDCNNFDELLYLYYYLHYYINQI